MAEFSLKDTLLFGGLLLGAGVIIRKIDESPEEVSEEVEVCESCVWVPTSIGTRNFIANCGGCGAEIKAPISQFREIVDVETLDAEELDEKVKNLIKVGDMKFREYADGTLERFEANEVCYRSCYEGHNWRLSGTPHLGEYTSDGRPIMNWRCDGCGQSKSSPTEPSSKADTHDWVLTKTKNWEDGIFTVYARCKRCGVEGYADGDVEESIDSVHPSLRAESFDAESFTTGQKNALIWFYLAYEAYATGEPVGSIYPDEWERIALNEGKCYDVDSTGYDLFLARRTLKSLLKKGLVEATRTNWSVSPQKLNQNPDLVSSLDFACIKLTSRGAELIERMYARREMGAESFDAEQVDYDVLLDGELMGIHESLESAKEAAEKLYVENGKSLGVEVLQMKYDDETLEGDVNGEQVFKLGAESFDAESVSDLKLQKDSCCCGATKKTPCVCMILGSDCSAKKPMCACYRLKAIQQKDEMKAETFEADSSNCVWCGSGNVCCTNEDSQNKVKGIKNRFGEYAIEASPMPHPTKEEYVCGNCCFIHGDKSVLIPNLIESSEVGHPLEEYEVLVSNNNMEFGLSHNTFRDKEEALDAALNLSQEQTDKFIYVRRDDGKVIRVFRPNHGYGAETLNDWMMLPNSCGNNDCLDGHCPQCGSCKDWADDKDDEGEVMYYCGSCGHNFYAETFEAPSCNCERFDRSDWDSNRCATCGEMRKGHYGAESRPASYMVKSDAHKLKEASKRIHEKADEHQKYPEWWKSKLSVSRNNADQLADFLDYAVIEGVFESEQHGDDEDDHEEIDELIEKLNTVVDFAITFIHDGGYGGEPKGTFVDTELGIKTEVVEYVEGSIQLRLVRDIDTDELLSVRFSLSGEPEETPIVYLPLPERLTLIPEDERSSK